MRLKKTYFFILIIIIIAAFVWRRSTTHQRQLMSTPVVDVKIHQVDQQYIEQQLYSAGTLLAPQMTNLSAQTSGYVQKIYFENGQKVEKHQVLFQLQDHQQRDDLNAKKAALELAQIKFKRGKLLVKQNNIAAQDFDTLKANYQQAAAALAQAKDSLAQTIIRAPFAGTLGAKQVSLGDYVNSGQVLVKLVNQKDLLVNYTVAEQYSSEIRLGQQVLLRSQALPKYHFTGKVSFIAPDVDPLTRTIQIQARVATQQNNANLLKPGMYMQVKQTLSQQHLADFIPEQSLVVDAGHFYVYVIKGTKALRLPVKIGQHRQGLVQILQGLGQYKQVIVAGQEKLKSGMQVKVLSSNPKRLDNSRTL